MCKRKIIRLQTPIVNKTQIKLCQDQAKITNKKKNSKTMLCYDSNDV